MAEATKRKLVGKCAMTLIVSHSFRYNAVTSVMQLADGRMCSVSRGTIQIWDLGTGACAMTLAGTGNVNSVMQMADGRLCIKTNNGRSATIEIWDLGTGACAMSLTSGVFCMMQLADGRVCCGDSDFNITIWDVRRARRGALAMTLSGHTGTVYCVIQLADGRVCSGSSYQSCTGDHTIKI